MHARLSGTALAAFLLTFQAAAQTASLAQQIAARLTANDLRADVSFLAADALEGRGTPSAGLNIAAEFIASQFRRAGLQPAGDDGYFQTADFASVTPNSEAPRLTIETADKKIDVAAGSMAVAEAAAVDLENAPVYRADAAAIERLGPDEVRGKVLMVAGFVDRAALARLHPALVIELLSAPRPTAGNARPQLHEAAAPVVPTVRVWDPAVRAAAGARSGPLDIRVRAHMGAPSTTPVKLRNVIGVLRGSDPALGGTYVMVTAHYDHLGVRGSGPGDHIYNGANDDASGTACVIELAQTLAALPARPKRSIVFMALFGEELGLVGSRYYGRHPVFPLVQTVADLNLEQMGRTDDNTGPRVGLVNVTGYDYTSITPVLAGAAREFGIRVVKDPEASDPFFARSDNQAFADAGVPAHTLSVGYVFSDYHQPGDEWPKLDYENMAKVDRGVALGLFRLADSADAPRWNSDNPKTERYRKAREADAGGR